MCALTVLRDFYFKNMQNLRYLDLWANQISIFEPEAFKDLTNVEKLFLNHNAIETLDEKLFKTMTSLETLLLNSNKIKFLNPSTFTIPNGSLRGVDLMSNLCINGDYSINGLKNLTSMIFDIDENCTR